MRITLVRPNSSLVVTPPPVGLGYLSYAVKTLRGDEVQIIDGRRLRIDSGEIMRRAGSFNPGVIGVTAMTFEAREAASLIHLMKLRWPDVPVILGGPHATGYGPSLLDKVQADYLVIGEGEDTLVELLDALEGKRDIGGVPGVARRDKGETVFNGERTLIEDMHRLAIDWEEIEPERYFGMWSRNAMNTVARTGRRLPVFTSRGCPFGCSYCHHIFGRDYRVFDPERTVAGMVDLRDRYGVREFEIIDDNFNLQPDRARTVMREVVERKLGCSLTFTNGLRADRMDEELLDLMVRAGTYRIDYAIESASPRIQKMIHKNLDLDRAREVVNMTAARRIVTGTYNMLGFPSETEEEMSLTVDYAVSLRNHIASFFYVMPFPGTELAESDPDISRRVREIDFGDASGISFNLSAAGDDTLRMMRRLAYRRFYFSSARVARIAADVPRNPRLIAAALAALRLSFRESVNY